MINILFIGTTKENIYDLLIGTTKENTYDLLIGTTDHTNAINLPLCQRT